MRTKLTKLNNDTNMWLGAVATIEYADPSIVLWHHKFLGFGFVKGHDLLVIKEGSCSKIKGLNKTYFACYTKE